MGVLMQKEVLYIVLILLGVGLLGMAARVMGFRTSRRKWWRQDEDE
jgi:uncharacterized membrane protein YesL